MAIKLIYITNDENIARIAEDSGVDWICVDLEIIGKAERQKNLDTVISHHCIDDISIIKKILTKSELLVRINPINAASEEEINRVIEDGADVIMLPFFHSTIEVKKFLDYVSGRVKTCLLLETPDAVTNIDDILSLDGIDFIHIGLNDLHLGYKMEFMFELLSNGTVERLCRKIKTKNIPFGFGGIAQIGQGTLPAEKILSEHYRLGSSMVILSRSFCNSSKLNDISDIRPVFNFGVNQIRIYEEKLSHESTDYFESNRNYVIKMVNKIMNDSGNSKNITNI